MRSLALFASSGIGELLLHEIGVETVVANELIPRRMDLFGATNPNCRCIPGDITDDNIFEEIINQSRLRGVENLIATPPCQGFSLAGKNKSKEQISSDKRNNLFLYAIDAIKELSLNTALIENVPRFLKSYLPYKGDLLLPEQILELELGDDYKFKIDVFNSADFGVPQSRHRAIVRIWKKGFVHDWPDPNSVNKHISVSEAIGNLPSLEPGQKSKLKWHFARNHEERMVTYMRHTPSGKTAHDNPIHYPKTKNGNRVKGFRATYNRMSWEKPAPTITMRNDAISSQSNVHPGRLLPNGTYSDPRVLTPLELFRLMGLPDDPGFPSSTPEILIRQSIGEGVPPLLINAILKTILK
jgi:DNA (cytosine-5)-methyltransferase 1